MRLITLTFLACYILFSCTETEPKPVNILMIAVDDLRPELGCYGNEMVHSPNIDRIASQGVVFSNSYCNIPVCGASRASIMTGARPTRFRFMDYYCHSEVEIPEAVCLSQLFKDNGYYTISNGKIFHNFSDRAESWNENWRPKTNQTWRDYHIKENVKMQLNGGGPPYENANVHDTAYHDGKLAEKTIADLKRMKETGKPFFIATGFVKPHLPFNAPKKYWDLYNTENFAPVQQKYWPENAPKQAFHNSGELRAYGHIPETGFIHDTMAIHMQHGYYACISYIDAQIGKVMTALEELGLDDNTVIVLWGDHGWNLGEHGIWCKHSNFNTSLKAPLIIKTPKQSKGIPSQAMVEFIDIFPTICDLANIEIPSTVEGLSLVPLMEDPNAEWKDYVICKWFDGLTIKTPDYALTEWRNDQDSLIAGMLYDHHSDMEETNNLWEDTNLENTVYELQSLMIKNRGKDYFKFSTRSTQEVDH